MKTLLIVCILLLPGIAAQAAGFEIWDDLELLAAMVKGDTRAVETRAIKNAIEVYRLREENSRLRANIAPQPPLSYRQKWEQREERILRAYENCASPIIKR